MTLLEEGEKYEISENDSGRRNMRLRAPWDASLAEIFRQRQIQSLSVGPKTPDLSFLTDLPDLVSFSYLHDRGIDTAPIHSLRNLRSLYFANVTGPKIDFRAFPKLEDCSMEWTSAVSNVFDAVGLRKLYIGNLPKQHFPRIANLIHLKDLTILGCQTATLDPLAGLIALEKIRLARFKKLEDARAFAQLRNLRSIYIQESTGFSSLEPFANLPHLARLALEDVGPVESFAPLRGHPNLERLTLTGKPDNRLLDGDLSIGWTLPRLKRYAVRGRNGVNWQEGDPRP